MRINDIVERLYAIDRWNRDNGFGNRGLKPTGYYADELKKADEIIAMAYDTLTKNENRYKHFFIEKCVEDFHLELQKYFAKLWEEIKNGWNTDPRDLGALYNHCVRHMPQLHALPPITNEHK